MAIAEEAEETDDGGQDPSGAGDERGTDTASDEPTASSEDRERTTTDSADDRYTRKKCVLITGCSSGIGRATAQAFLEEDWQVVATARNTDDISDLAEAGCTTLELDVTEPDQVARVVEETVELGGAIDCLVNNAGYAQMGPIEDVSTLDLHRQFDVNVYGPHRLARAALPHMRAQGEGRIINVSSVLGRLSFAGTGPYSGSKHALEAMSDSLRAEVEEFGIEVVLIEPGTVETEFVERTDDELPENRTPAYETLYEIYDDAQLIGGGGPLALKPTDVSEAIVEAGTAREPPARYPVGPMAQYGSYARFLPDRIRDAAYGLLQKFV
ncbi:SDR family oxidoreductase [Halostagnicola kamekurae]|uniref:NADP-dependent 3-hydroxy acid dehydrogenase YdfG n=1 Tax=Halostagnicola kamekurae TaxID=619731 RepID=A0A1I6QJI5_9EURY|nr:SDR family oxidoreductase [Halostagnicola kamekurae]SFS52619.1 NADP-dependent 3-hydroxy acid dehydrogenase YdfG [Halostagnicola kamekurae]